MIADEETLAGYHSVHGRAPAFEGSDGHPYSVGVFSDDDPAPDGSYGAALLFIRWSKENQPDGHLETDYLARSADAADAEAALGRLTLTEVKAHLERLITRRATS